MTFIILVIAALLILSFPTLRCAVSHPLKLVRYGVVDLYQYIKYQKWNECSTGELIAYVGLFGKGKTLSAVHKVVSMYEQYDGKAVWDKERQMWVEQRVKVLSNVALSIPYDDFVSLQQVVYCAEKNGQYDEEHDTLTVTLVLGDEFSVQMNSRNFKSNIDPLFLNTLLTCRHYHISMFYTAQRFGHVDALLRQVTSCVVDCNKLWRFQRQNLYDAWEVENATSPRLVSPIARRCWFVTDRDYNAYNTLACVGNLQKSFKEGDMLSEEEINFSILAAIGNLIAWIFIPLGWGNWQATVASITGLVAKENIVGTLGILYGGGELTVYQNIAAAFTGITGYSFLVFNLLCAPCFAAIGAIKREMNNAKWTWFAIGYQCGFAYLIALMINQFGNAFTGSLNVIGLIAAIAALALIIYMLFKPYQEATKLKTR